MVALPVGLAVAVTLVLDVLQSSSPSAGLHGTILPPAGMVALSSLVVGVGVLLVLALTGRPSLTAGVVLIATLVIGFANREKLALRREPLYPSDLAFAAHPSFLSDMVGGVALVLLAVTAGVILVGSVLLGRYLRRWFPRVRRTTSRRATAGLLAARALTVVLASLSLLYAGQFNHPGNLLRGAYEHAGAHWRPWNQATNYTGNGFVAGALYNTDVPSMTRPPGYNRATMTAIGKRYDAAADRINASRSRSDLGGVNVVLVLSETFTDPTQVKGVTVAEDPIPFTRRLMRNTVAGTMLASQFGGGTANMEFGAITGQSLSLLPPQLTTPYQMLVPQHEHFPSLVDYFTRCGHRTVAIHPFLSSLYRRDDVYRSFGFDEAMFAKDIANPTIIDTNEHIADSTAFDETAKEMTQSQAPVFVNLVTMQNHYPMAGSYADPIPVSGVTGEARRNAEHYARGLRHSDDALRHFLAGVRRSGENTVVLFYGDHQPALWPESVRRANGVRAMLETPFFVWTNIRDLPARTLPTTSPIYFADHIFAAADAAVPPYYALLTRLERKIPAMSHQMTIGPDNRRVEQSELPVEARRLLNDYRLVQYDLSVGKGYVAEQMFAPPEGC